MVRYVFTPWRDRQELLLVRRQFYPSTSPTVTKQVPPSSNASELPSRSAEPEQKLCRQQDQHAAVARVSMWMQRGNCPHMVESTALLTAAVLSDEAAASASEHSASSAYAIRAAYSAAFSRFVTGLLDGHQDKQRKQSMYSVAKTIGLPATFVELRHQSTHEQLPSRAKLRSAATKALAWIWDYYWKQLPEDNMPVVDVQSHPCAQAVLRYLQEEDESRRQRARDELGAWDRDHVLTTITELQASFPGNQVFLKCLKLSQELSEVVKTTQSDQSMAVDGSRTAHESEVVEEEVGTGGVAGASAVQESEPEKFSTGWSPYRGSWKPKPIGIV